MKSDLTQAMPFCIIVNVSCNQKSDSSSEVLNKVRRQLDLEERAKVFTCTLHTLHNKNLEFFRLKTLEDSDNLFDDGDLERHLWIEYPNKSQQVSELKIKS